VCLVLLFFFFFFQAEDGIRDRNVTGVQTCALPILTRRSFNNSKRSSILFSNFAMFFSNALISFSFFVMSPFTDDNFLSFAFKARSEERRVGKECRTTMWTYSCK